MSSDLLTPLQRCWDTIYFRTDKARFFPGLLTVLVVAGLFFLLLPGIPAGHDLGFHLSRLQSLADGLKHGYFPVWINFDALEGFGYGYGFFYSDLYLYPVALLICLGMPVIVAYKCFLLTWALLCAWSMYWVAWRIGKDHFGAFAAALLYVWSSYFAIDVFSRAALGEVTAFLFLPWIALGLYDCIWGEARRFLPLALGFGGLFYAHSITFVLAAIISFLLLVFNLPALLKDVRRIGWIACAGVVAGGCALAAIVPMFEQMAYLKFNLTGRTMASPVAERAVPFIRLFLELPYTKLAEWMPPGIGMIFVIVVCQRLRFKTTGDAAARFRDASLLVGCFALLAATRFLPWEGIMRILSSIQFPWRFYLPATAFLALGGGLTLATLMGGEEKRRRFWCWVLLCGCGFAWLFNVAYVYAAKISEKKIWRTYTLEDSRKYATSGQHYLPQGARVSDYRGRGNQVRFLGASPTKYTWSRPRYGEGLLTVEGLEADTVAELPLTPYIGYKAELSTGRLIVLDLAHGAFRLPLDQNSGTTTVRIFYSNTAAQTVALLGSLIVWIGVGGWAFLAHRKKKKDLRCCKKV